jgi:hypothetical protein
MLRRRHARLAYLKPEAPPTSPRNKRDVGQRRAGQGAEQLAVTANAERLAGVGPPRERVIGGGVEAAGLRLAALGAQEPDAVLVHVHVGGPHGQDLGDPQPAAVEQGQQGPVPDAGRRPPRALPDDRGDLGGGQRLGGVLPARVRRRMARPLPELPLSTASFTSHTIRRPADRNSGPGALIHRLSHLPTVYGHPADLHRNRLNVRSGSDVVHPRITGGSELYPLDLRQ